MVLLGEVAGLRPATRGAPEDAFLAAQLQPERLEAACTAAGQPLAPRRHPGDDHSYWFIQTVIDDHLRHHAAALGLG